MERHDQHDFDYEVVTLVDKLNQKHGSTLAVVEPDVEELLNVVTAIVPQNSIHRGIDWEKALSSSGPPRIESAEETRSRLIREINSILSACSASGDATFISDDSYGVGITCNRRLADDVLNSWVSLPHTIFILVPKCGCYNITMTRAAYWFACSTDLEV